MNDENKLQVMPKEGGALAVLPKTQVDMLLETIAPAIKGGTDPAVVREQIALMKDLMAMKAKESFDAAINERKYETCPNRPLW